MKNSKKNFKNTLANIRVDDILDDDPDNPFWDFCTKTPQYTKLQRDVNKTIQHGKDRKKPIRKNAKDDVNEDDFLQKGRPKV